MLALSTTPAQPNRARSGPVPDSGNISGVAPAGETIGNSTTFAEASPGRCATRNPPPPMPLIHGSTTPETNAVVTAASTALPPALNTAAPASAASTDLAPTIPP